MLYLIDTNIFVYFVSDKNLLDKNVRAIFEDYENTFCISSESVKELIVAYRNKKLLVKQWKTEIDMVNSIEKDFGLKILPVGKKEMQIYAKLRLNTAQGHNDPSDHVIISQAIALKHPLISSDHKFKFYEKQGLEFVHNEK